MPKIKIDFTDARDLDVLVLGALGFSTSYIEAKTKRTTCQIAYRLRITGVKRADYRSGTGPVAKLVLATSRGAATAKMVTVANSAAVRGRTHK